MHRGEPGLLQGWPQTPMPLQEDGQGLYPGNLLLTHLLPDHRVHLCPSPYTPPDDP